MACVTHPPEPLAREADSPASMWERALPRKDGPGAGPSEVAAGGWPECAASCSAQRLADGRWV